MEKCLLILIFIAVFASSISATKSYCERHENSEYYICRYADTITFIYRTRKANGLLRLNVNKFSAIAPYAFKNLKIRRLAFYSPRTRKCNPKIVHITPESFGGLSVSALSLNCMKFAVKPNPFANLRFISSLTLRRIELMGNISGFFANFPLLKDLKLFDLNITTISPDIFPGINERRKELIITDVINGVKPKSFERLHNLETLGQRVELPSYMFDGLTQLKSLDLSGNKITLLRRHTFSKLLQLETLDLSNNKISEIEFETFPLSLKILELKDNNLKNLPIGAFHNLRNLFHVDLKSNGIRNVPYNVFEECILLQFLFLNHNEINYLEPNAFWGLYLNELDLSHNHLSVLQHDAFNGLQVEGLLDLRFNYINEIKPQAFRNLKATSVLLCWNHHNNSITHIDRNSWGISQSIKKILINDCPIIED